MSRSLFARLADRYDPNSNAASRRGFLKATLAASAGLLLSSMAGCGSGPAVGGSTKPKVAIVGAGFAGLACGHELKAAGYDVTLFDARNRVGGRVLSFSDFIPGKNVEGGGELIGSNHPTWIAYKDLFKLEFIDMSEDEGLVLPLYMLGKLVDNETGPKVWEQIDEQLDKMNALAATVDAEQPWKSPKAAELDKQTIADFLRSLEVKDEIIRKAIEVQVASDNGVENDKASLLGMLAVVKGGGLEKYWSDSEVYRCSGGNAQLGKKLAEGIGADRIQLSTPISKIEVKGKTIEITLPDGKTQTFDDVVLAVPPSTWNKIEIKPGLPAVLKPQMGTAVKYEVALKKRYWTADKLGQYSLSDGDMSQTWELTDAQPDDPPGSTPVGMVGFSGGAAAERARKGPKEDRDARYAAEFETLYPGFKENRLTGTAKDIRFMDWPAEEWTLAGYSFPAPGQVTTMGQILYDGIGHLHFAGEHCSTKFTGYMEGGLDSGASLAKRIAKRDGVVKG